MFNGTMTFKSISSSTLGLILTEPPQIEHSQLQDGNEIVVPGRNGYLYSVDQSRGSAAINVKLALYKPGYALGYTDGAYRTAVRAVYDWLSGSGTLTFSDFANAHYEVQKVEITSDTREVVNFGTIEAKLTVYPLEFRSTPTKQNFTVNPSSTATFTLDGNANYGEPLYEVTTENSGGTVTINGHTITVAASQTFNIDVRRRMAYSGSTDKSNKMSGDYSGMILGSSNTITTDAGMTFKIVSSRDGYII